MESTRRRSSAGRKKVAIAPIINRNRRAVCFTKRRKGIFKKARELAVLCGSEVAVVTNSSTGKPFSFGYPSAESVIDRHLALRGPPPRVLLPLDAPTNWFDRKPGEPRGCPFWWVDLIHMIDLQDLEMMTRSLEKIQRAAVTQANVLARAREEVLEGGSMPGDSSRLLC